MSDLTICLWLNDQAEEAANFYAELLGGEVTSTARVNEAQAAHGNAKVGDALLATWRVDGQKFMAINGNGEYQLTPAASVMIFRDEQNEIDRIYDAFADGGEEIQCGWVTDRFGLTWQVVPKQMEGWMTAGGEPTRRVTAAMMQMKKLHIPTLQAAFEGEAVPAG